MKKKVLIVILAVCLIAIIIFGMYLIDRNRMKNNKPVIFSNWGYSYVPPINLPLEEIESAIMSFIVDRGDNEKHHENAKTFASMEVYLIEEKESFTKFNIYAWVLEEKYYLENNEIKQDGGSSIPYKFIVENIDGKFTVTDFVIPRDGSYYADDMKSIFPSSVRENMEDIHTDGTIEELNIDIKEQVEEYFNMNNKQSEEGHFFYGKVVESTASYIIVEPNENEEERKSADKISVGLGENNDALYTVGTNVKITYDGTIMESYPAKVNATKIEIKSAEDFEILFYDKHPMESYRIYTILDKSETDKYDYTIYGYDGSVNIRIDGKDYSLKEALIENKITMEEIIAKANQDEKDGKIKAETYKDGGSMEYHYENYTIIKYHTLDGNRDVYIGTKDLKLNNIK